MAGASKGFDFPGAMRNVCADMTRRLAPLAHIDIQRVAIGTRQTRHNAPHGVFATLTALGGYKRRQPLVDLAGRPFLYLLNFYLPRFHNLPLEEKLSTIVHELWHIGPEFDGDLRRHPGRFFAHGPSQRQYDAHMNRLAQQWLAADPPHHLYDFLQRTFDELAAEFGSVRGLRWQLPKVARCQS